MQKPIYLAFLALLAASFFLSCGRAQESEEQKIEGTPATNVPEPVISSSTILSGYEIIWGMDVLPNGDLLFGERRGRLYLRSGDKVNEVSGFPQVRTGGQGGASGYPSASGLCEKRVDICHAFRHGYRQQRGTALSAV